MRLYLLVVIIHKKCEYSLTRTWDQVTGCRIQDPGLRIRQPKLREMKYKGHINNFSQICYKESCLRQYDSVNVTLTL